MTDSIVHLRFVYIAEHLAPSPNLLPRVFDGQGFSADLYPVCEAAEVSVTLAQQDWDLVLVEWPVVGLEMLSEIKRARRNHPQLSFVALAERSAETDALYAAREAVGGEALAWDELPSRLADLIPANRQVGLDREAAQAMLQQRVRELMALHGITSAAFESVSENDLYERVTDIIANTIHPSRFGIMVLDAANYQLILHSSYRGLAAEHVLREVPLGVGVAGTVALTGQSLNIPDVSQCELYMSNGAPMRSEICVPIKIDSRVVGVVNAESVHPFAFSAEDERLLVTLAFQLGLAVGRLRNDEALRARTKQLLAIHDASEEIAAASLDVEAVSQAIYHAVSSLLPFDAFALTRWDRASHEIEAIYLVDEEKRYPIQRVRDDRGWSSYVLKTGVSLKINDAAHENMVTAEPVSYGDGGDSRSVLVAPLKLAGRTVGTVTVQSYRPSAFSWDDLRLLELIAGHAAIALENSRLYEETSRQALTFANMFDAVVISDRARRIVDWNPAAERLLGYRREEALRQEVSLIYPPDQVAAIQGNIVSGLQREGRYRGEVTFVRKGGSRGIAELVVVAVYGAGGQIVASIGVLRDITKQRKAEEALRISEARLAGIINSAMDGIITVDEASSIFLFNRAAERMFGLGASEAVGQPLECWLPGFPDLAGRSYALGLRADGEKFPVEVSISQVSVDGRVYQTAIVRDITERVRAQMEMSRLAGVVQQAAETILLTDLNGNITYINPYGEKVTGYSAGEVLGQTPRLFKSGQHDAAFYRQLWDTLLRGQPWTGVLTNRRKDGSLIHETATIFPVQDETGAATGYAAVKRDISLEVQREREMQAIVSVSTALRKAVTRKEMLPIILEQLIAILDGVEAAIGFYDAGSDELFIEMGWGCLSHYNGLHVARGQGISGFIFERGGPLQTADVTREECFRPVIPDLRSRAVIGAPLIAQGEPIGVLWVGRGLPFSAGEFRVFQAVADMSANAIHRASLHERTLRYAEQTVAITAAGRAMAETLNLAQVYERLARSVDELLPNVDLLGILRVNLPDYSCRCIYAVREGQAMDVSAFSAFQLNSEKNDALARAIRSHEAVVVPFLSQAEFDVAILSCVTEREGSAVIVPLVAHGRALGLLGLIDRQVNRFTHEDASLLALIGNTAATAMENADLYQGLQHSNAELLEAYEQTLEGWSKALDLRDRETENHTQRVTTMTLDLARELGFTGEQLVHVRRGAMLHDIGKLGVQDRILLKTGPLDKEEWEEMRRHPVLAYEMLSPIGYLRSALSIPYCHHEKWDGSGYPRGLRDEEIPLEARIFAIVDVYDALTNHRPYRPAWSHEQAIQYIREQAGKHFDPSLVPVFLHLAGGG